MYNNVGKGIKNIVSTFVKIQIVLYVILGIILLIASIASEVFIGVFLSIIFVALACWLAWVGGLILYAYGEITDCVQKLADTTQEDKAEEEPLSVEVDPWAEGSWKCNSCGTENPLKRRYCLKCNTAKEWSDTK